MTMNWSQQKYDCMPVAEREARRYLRIYPKTVASMLRKQQSDHRLMNTRKQKSHPVAGYRRWKWLMTAAMTLAALAGTIAYFFLAVPSVVFVAMAMLVAAILLLLSLGEGR
jgi:hypothetical protein